MTKTLPFLQSKRAGIEMIRENPGVFTEGSCCLTWIAESYDMDLGAGLSTGCRPASGNIMDNDKKEC